MSDNRAAKRPKTNSSSVISDGHRKAVFKLKLFDAEENPLTIEAVESLSVERRNHYASLVEGFPGTDDARVVASATCSNVDGHKIEHIVVMNAEAPYDCKPALQEDKITLEQEPLSSMVEYRFGPDKPWLLAKVSKESLVHHRASKFESWKELLMTGAGHCARAFRRMLQAGLITNLYDPVYLPSPPDEAADWQVEDKPGTKVDVPRPVYELRVWDADTSGYIPLAPRMDGAPKAGEDHYWKGLLAELRWLHGASTIDRLLTDDDAAAAAEGYHFGLYNYKAN